MRETYRSELADITKDLVTMSEAVQVAVRDASRALLEADLEIAEQVISSDKHLDELHDQLEQRCFTLLARQAPVAGDLRIVVTAIQMINAMGRAGDLAAHIAKIARLRHPDSAVPASLRENFVRMSEISEQMIVQASTALANRDFELAQQMADEDTEMDELRSQQFTVLLGSDWSDGIEAAVDAALLGRYFERISDHAVALGKRVIYIITGEAPQGEDWPTT